MGVVGETIEDEDEPEESHINGARVLDKSKHYRLYRLELWINTRDPIKKEKIRDRLRDIMTDGQPASQKLHPKFEWRDHS